MGLGLFVFALRLVIVAVVWVRVSQSIVAGIAVMVFGIGWATDALVQASEK